MRQIRHGKCAKQGWGAYMAWAKIYVFYKPHWTRNHLPYLAAFTVADYVTLTGVCTAVQLVLFCVYIFSAVTAFDQTPQWWGGGLTTALIKHTPKTLFLRIPKFSNHCFCCVWPKPTVMGSLSYDDMSLMLIKHSPKTLFLRIHFLVTAFGQNPQWWEVCLMTMSLTLSIAQNHYSISMHSFSSHCFWSKPTVMGSLSYDNVPYVKHSPKSLQYFYAFIF